MPEENRNFRVEVRPLVYPQSPPFDVSSRASCDEIAEEIRGTMRDVKVAVFPDVAGLTLTNDLAKILNRHCAENASNCEDCQRNYTDAGAAIRRLERALLWAATKIAHYNDIAYYAKAVGEADHPITEGDWVTWALEASK